MDLPPVAVPDFWPGLGQDGDTGGINTKHFLVRSRRDVGIVDTMDGANVGDNGMCPCQV